MTRIITKIRGARTKRIALFSVSTLILASCASMGSAPQSERISRIESSQNYGDEIFINSVPTSTSPKDGMLGLAWKFLFYDGQREPETPPTINQLGPDSFSAPPPDGLRITWLGHASALIEIDGQTILTDPIMSERSSPFSWAGPERFYPSPISVKDLPYLDAVLISHDHYDHLDHDTIVALQDKTQAFLVPLGVGAHLESWGIAPEKIIVLDWWESVSLTDDFHLISTPARHFSGRGLTNRNSTLWCSWAITGPRHRVFFGGDTGYFPGFSEIGQRLGPFDMTLLPVGAYGDKWPDIHMNPEDALLAHWDLQGELFIPIHWGTFKLALHPWTEPAEWTLRVAKELNIPIEFPPPGGSVTLTPDANAANSELAFKDYWWRAADQPQTIVSLP